MVWGVLGYPVVRNPDMEPEPTNRKGGGGRCDGMEIQESPQIPHPDFCVSQSVQIASLPPRTFELIATSPAVYAPSGARRAARSGIVRPQPNSFKGKPKPRSEGPANGRRTRCAIDEHGTLGQENFDAGYPASPRHPTPRCFTSLWNVPCPRLVAPATGGPVPRTGPAPPDPVSRPQREHSDPPRHAAHAADPRR